MSDRRKKNADWMLNLNVDGTASNNDARLAVLMDIRDELQTLNRLLGCVNCIEIPSILRRVEKNTRQPVKKRAKKSEAAR